MKSSEIKVLSACIALLFTASVLTGCGDKEKTDWKEKRAEMKAQEGGETVIEPEPITSFEEVEEIQTFDGLSLDDDAGSMQGLLDSISDSVDEGFDAAEDAIGEAGEAISDTTESMLDAAGDGMAAAQDTTGDMYESMTETVDAAIVEPVAEMIDDADEVVAATPDLIRQVQQSLANAGYNPGPADGISGPKTDAALKSFQQDNNLAAGELTKETLRALGVNY